VAKRSLIYHGSELVRHIAPKVIRPIHSLWHEVIGFLFLSLGFLGSVSGFRLVRNYDDSPATLFRLIVIACFVIIMFGYGISSFLKARKITRS
jgi:hypothetical protein